MNIKNTTLNFFAACAVPNAPLPLPTLTAPIDLFCLEVERVGSRVTCNPPPTDTDEDFLVLIDNSNFDNFFSILHHSGYDLGGSDFTDEDISADKSFFRSYKKGITNLIVTADREFFDNFMRATKIAKELNLLDKEDRIKLFQKILYDSEEAPNPVGLLKDHFFSGNWSKPPDTLDLKIIKQEPT